MAMEIDLGPGAERFRDELRQWLEANRPASLPRAAQVRRNIVGERALGLPKEPGQDAR